MNVAKFANSTVKFVGAVGIGALVSDFLAENLPEVGDSKLDKTIRIIGLTVVGLVLTAAIAKSFDSVVDGIIKIDNLIE